MSWIAYGDESIRAESRAYIFAAILLDETELDQVQEAARGLPRPQGLPFHWREHGAPNHHLAATVVAGLPSLHIVVVGSSMDPRRQERARRKCLGELLFRLQEAGVFQVWLESRGDAADRRDIAAVDAFRTQKRIGESIRVDHDRPGHEEALWIADIVAGAVSAAEAGEPVYRELLAPVLTEHRVDVT